VKALARDLVRRGRKLDAVIWNAGIPGWKGRNWPLAVWHVIIKTVEACTYPEFNISDVGLLAKRQIPQTGASQPTEKQDDEPRLGQVFLANVFGHYMLTHWLCPVFTPDTRIIWTSSVSATWSVFNVEDIQGIQSPCAYESSKRLTDLLVLTSELPSTKPYISTFLSIPKDSRPAIPIGLVTTQQQASPSRPRMLLTHPGVVSTEISGLGLLLSLLMTAAFYFCRLLGSPWHPIDPYKSSVSAVFAALAPPHQFLDYEDRDGKGKWGSSTDVFGHERVARTEVQGWGFCGVPGQIPEGSVNSRVARWRGWTPGTKEEREEFEVLGQKVWREMEGLRREWEGRLEGA
jgi:3-keto steroid reductase